MGEVIVLADWKKKKEIESLNLLESEVESLMDFHGLILLTLYSLKSNLLKI